MVKKTENRKIAEFPKYETFISKKSEKILKAKSHCKGIFVNKFNVFFLLLCKRSTNSGNVTLALQRKIYMRDSGNAFRCFCFPDY